VPVRDELWLDDVLDCVGPSGTFLGERSTRANVRAGEWRLSDFGVQGSWDAWRTEGATRSLDSAREHVDEILESQVSLPYADDVAAALRDLELRAAASA